MQIYHLMNKEQALLSFYITEEYGEKTAYQDERFVHPSLLPVGFTDIQSWLNQRNIAKHKTHLRRWLKEWQIDDLEGFIQITRIIPKRLFLDPGRGLQASLARNKSIHQ